MVTIKVGVVSLPRILGRVITGMLMFKDFCNSHFYNYSLHRNVVVAIIKIGVVSPPRIAKMLNSYYW